MVRLALVLAAGTLLAGCDRSSTDRDLVSLDGEDAAYEPLPPLRDPEPGAALPEPLYQSGG